MTTKSKIINGQSFEISQPYEPGYAINEAEARALNQVRSENIGNNVREKVKELLEAGDVNGAIAYVAEKDNSYVFNLASVSAAVKRDPVETEARKLAKDIVKQKLAESGRKPSVVPEGLTKEEWEEKIEGEVERISQLEPIVKAAKKNVDERAKKGKALLEATGDVSI